MLRVFGGVLSMVASMAAAQDLRFVSTDGDLFAFEENRHGAVLTALPSDGAAIIGTPGQRLTRSGDIVYLGRSCDAFSERFGGGSWRWTDGGFIVFFGATRLSFPGQVIDLQTGQNCRQ